MQILENVTGKKLEMWSEKVAGQAMDELWFLMSERQVLKLHLIVARSPLFLALYDRGGRLSDQHVP